MAHFSLLHVNDPLGAVERLQDEDKVLNCPHPPNTEQFTNPSVDVGVGSSLHGVPKTLVLTNMSQTFGGCWDKQQHFSSQKT